MTKNTRPSLFLLLATASLMLSGCIYNNNTKYLPDGMKIATVDMIGNCRLIGDIQADRQEIGAQQSQWSARGMASYEAKKLGANTIVWGETIRVAEHPWTMPTYVVKGAAYFCQPQ